MPNNNNVDKVLNGPSGEMAPSTKPPYCSPKWNWEPQMSSMRHAWTNEDDLESADCGIDQSEPIEIRPKELCEELTPPLAPQTIQDQTGATAGNTCLDEVVTEIRVGDGISCLPTNHVP